MKVVIQKKVIVIDKLCFTEEQAKWLFNVAKDLKGRNRLYTDILDSFGNNGRFENGRDYYVISHSDSKDMKYRSHPLIIKACEDYPSQNHEIVEIEGFHYKIMVMYEDFSERVFTPCLKDFVRGFAYSYKQNAFMEITA